LQSTLLIIDPQTRLMPSIDDGEEIVRRCLQLAMGARELGVHVIGTEENPAGLGPIVAELRGLCDTTLSKYHFAAVDEPGFMERLPQGRDTLVVAGCEAHVCVLQTVLGLLAEGGRAVVVADAIGSRDPGNAAAAVERMARHGAEVVTSEMVLFEWLRDATHPSFRQVHKLLK